MMNDVMTACMLTCMLPRRRRASHQKGIKGTAPMSSHDPQLGSGAVLGCRLGCGLGCGLGAVGLARLCSWPCCVGHRRFRGSRLGMAGLNSTFQLGIAVHASIHAAAEAKGDEAQKAKKSEEPRSLDAQSVVGGGRWRRRMRRRGWRRRIRRRGWRRRAHGHDLGDDGDDGGGGDRQSGEVRGGIGGR